MALYNYNPELVKLSAGGLPLDGMADGTFIEVDLERDSVTFMEGSDGTKAKVTRTALPIGTITLTVMQGSRANKILTSLFAAQQAAQGVTFIPVSVVNILGGSLATIAQGAITRPPQVAYAKEDGTRKWMFKGECFINEQGAIDA